LLPNVSADALHDLLDTVEAHVLTVNPSCRDALPPRVPSPWIREKGERWPREPTSDYTTRNS
jgi:hypothetical protein